jgi:hypothetical protein
LAKVRENTSETLRGVGDVLIALTSGFLSMFAGSWALSHAEQVPLAAKTAIAIGVGAAGGFLVARWHKPLGYGIAAGLGGLGMTALIAQAAGAADAGKLFGFQEASEYRARRKISFEAPRAPVPGVAARVRRSA